MTGPSPLLKRSIAIALLSLCPVLAVMAGPQRQLIGMSHDHLAADATDCDHFLTKTLTSFPANAHAQEQREIPLKGLGSLVVNSGREGGISVRGWDKPHARLIICRYAAAETKPAATALLGSVQVTSARGAIAASGPEGVDNGAWWVNMILYVPRKAKLEIVAENGAIAIRNLSGNVTARATNGGISVAECSGHHRVSTVSGGISLEKIAGRLDATTETGPIAFKLHSGTAPSLEASTDDDGEILCNLAGCTDGEGNWTPNRKRLRIGASDPSIRLSTSSAPIIIDQVR